MMIDEVDARIIQEMKLNPHVKLSEIGEKLYYDRTTISNHVKKLKEKGVVIRHGTRTNSSWEIVDS